MNLHSFHCTGRAGRLQKTLFTRVARWFLFEPKIPNWEILEGLAMEDVGVCMAVWSIFLPFGIFYGHFVYFHPFWYILPVLVFCTKKNLATLLYTWL
jgi:hypothetical protein